MQTENAAVKNYLVNTIDRFLREIDNTIKHVVELREINTGNTKNGRMRALIPPLASEFEALARQWRRDKVAALAEATAFHLLEIAESVTDRMDRIANSEPAKSARDSDRTANEHHNDDSQTEPAAATIVHPHPERADDSMLEPHGRLKGGLSGCNGGMSPGTLKHRTLVSFLESHAFERDSKQTGERAYRHQTGARVSIPPKHARGEIAKGTACKILRRIGKILDCDLRLLGGQIVVVGG